jgi:hypothetical protein
MSTTIITTTKQVRCKSGLIGWQGKLQDQYKTADEFVSYSHTYGLHTRLGYATPEEAWEANPTVQGSVNPADFRKVIPGVLVLSKGTSARGAQFGRRDELPEDREAPIKLRLEKLRWVDGDYDQFGAYWGYTSGTDIYCAWGEDDVKQVLVFVRAATRAFAKHLVVEKVPGATFYDGPGSPTPPAPEKRVQFTLLAPFEISSRLLPALRIGGAWISLEYSALPGRGDGRIVYRYYIDLPDGYEHTANNLKSGCFGGTLQEGFQSLLAFLGSADEELFPAKVVEWARQNEDEIGLLKCEIEETKGLIDEQG